MKAAGKKSTAMGGKKATVSRKSLTPTKTSSLPKPGRRLSVTPAPMPKTSDPIRSDPTEDTEDEIAAVSVPPKRKTSETPEKLPASELKKLRKVESLLPDSVELRSVEGVDLDEEHIEGALQISQFLAAFAFVRIYDSYCLLVLWTLCI